MTIEQLIASELDAIADAKDRALIGGILHQTFLNLMIRSGIAEMEPLKKACQQEILACALQAVTQYAQKPRMQVQKPVKYLTTPPTPTKP